MWAGSARWAERRSEAAGAAPAYIYRFDFATPVLDGAIGAAHGGDIPFAMANYTASSMAGDRPENPAMAKIMSDTWVNFAARSEEHTSELQSLMRISYAVFCLKKKKQKLTQNCNINIDTQLQAIPT